MDDLRASGRPDLLRGGRPRACRVVYAGTSSGLFRSTDGAGTWNLVVGLGDQPVNALALHPRAPRIIYAGVPGAMLRSDDRGEHWTAVLHDVFVEDPLIDPDHPWIVYVLARYVFSGTTGMLKSTRRGPVVAPHRRRDPDARQPKRTRHGSR